MRDVYLFTTTIVLMLLLGGGGYFYHVQITTQLVNDYTTKIAGLNNEITELNTKLLSQEQQLSSTKQKVDFVEKKLAVTSQKLSQDLQSTTSFLQTNIDSVKEISQQQIEQLSGQLEQVELKSLSNLEDLKSQLSNLGVSEDFANQIEQVLPAVVAINANGGVGSGAVYSSDGYIVTNQHVVAGLSTVTIRTFNQKQYTGEVVGESETKDIAVVKINANNLPFLTFGNSGTARVGEKVVALGSPGGLDFTVTEGIISALNRIINGVNYLQTDVSINPGNSGGPLINKVGQIIGINTMKIQGFEGVGFAISSNEVQAAINEII